VLRTYVVGSTKLKVRAEGHTRRHGPGGRLSQGRTVSGRQVTEATCRRSSLSNTVEYKTHCYHCHNARQERQHVFSLSSFSPQSMDKSVVPVLYQLTFQLLDSTADHQSANIL
jgi:hypothetical protein